jgi:hypothetical protein
LSVGTNRGHGLQIRRAAVHGVIMRLRRDIFGKVRGASQRRWFSLSEPCKDVIALLQRAFYLYFDGNFQAEACVVQRTNFSSPEGTKEHRLLLSLNERDPARHIPD